MSSTSAPELRFDRDAPIPAAWGLAIALTCAHIGTALVWAAPSGSSLGGALVLGRSARLRAMAGGQVEILVAHEPWRLVRSVLLHADAAHLALNAIAILVLGRLLEPWVGGARFLWWFALAGVGASLASHAAGLAQSDGASGGAFGLLGAVTALSWRHRDRLDPEDRPLAQRILPLFIALNLAFSLVFPFVDAVAHGAGLFIGLALGSGSRPQRPTRRTAWLEGIGVAIWAGIALLGPAWTGR